MDGGTVPDRQASVEDDSEVKGLGGGLKAEEDRGVQVTDFGKEEKAGRNTGDKPESQASASASSPPAGTRRGSPDGEMEAPEDDETWNEFLSQYTAGQVHTLAFPLSARSSRPASASGSRIRRPSSNVSKSELGTPANTRTASLRGLKPDSSMTSASSNTIVAAQAQGKSGTRVRPKKEDKSGSSSSHDSSPDDGDFKDRHRIKSSSGAANQDPYIPNLSPSEYDAGSSKNPAVTGYVGSKLRPRPKQDLTQEHVAQLNEENQNAADAEADAEITPDEHEGTAGGASSSVRRRRQRRLPRDVELGSVKAVDSLSSSEEEGRKRGGSTSSRRSRPRRPPLPSAQKSYRSNASHSRHSDSLPLDQMLLGSSTNSSSNHSVQDSPYDFSHERDRVRDFFEKHGYMPAPRQSPEVTRRRLRIIRRLGLERPDELHQKSIDRFTRLAVSIFKTSKALVSVIGRERQVFLSEIGLGVKSTSFEDAFCCHTIMGTGEMCMVVPDAARDWRFAQNPLVEQGKGVIQFYAGAPLTVGKGSKATIIGSMCIIDDKPRYDFDEEGKRLLRDLAECAVSELELLYNQRATVDAAKLHQISVDFLRRSLKHRPLERAGVSRRAQTDEATTVTMTSSTGSAVSTGKRNSGADGKQADEDVDLFDEACQEIRFALDAHAVAIVDLSQFHLFYPSYQTSTQGGSISGGGSQAFGSRYSGNQSRYGQSGPVGESSRASTHDGSTASNDDAYSKSGDGKAARKTYAVVDPMAAGRAPQVLFVPSSNTTTGRSSTKIAAMDATNNLPILGYSCGKDGFAFNFSASPAGRKVVCDFIARNVKGRTVWYSRDDSEGVAESITHLMPPGTEASLAMPVFGFDGQVAFAVVGCWTDPLFTYPAGALQFIETIAGSLLASVMKERLHQAERAQLNFAAAASHELRTPLHQINAAAALLRLALQSSLSQSPSASPELETPSQAPPPITAKPDKLQIIRDDKKEAIGHLEVIEANGVALGQILENIIDTLDIGRASTITPKTDAMDPTVMLPDRPEQMHNMSDLMEDVVRECIMNESKARRVAGEKGLEDVEVILEFIPRLRGRWMLATDPGPLSRALNKIIHNACKFTDKGYIHITVQDVSREINLPGGYDNSIKNSQVVIAVKDTGRGMSADFLDRTILRPFAKADPFMPGAGLGLGLAQRMIEVLGGKLAIKSTLNKGTLVRIEIPLHLLNGDNDSDVDDLIRQNEHYTARVSSPVRQDGIMLVGFNESDSGTRRVGRVLLRQLKLRYCRVVDQIQFASLIVIPDGVVTDDQLKQLVVAARPNVEVISLLSSRQALATGPTAQPSSSGAASSDSSLAMRDQIRIHYLTRPLFPSLVRRIVRPPHREKPPVETYVSDVVGGDEARRERAADNEGPEDEDVLPSPASLASAGELALSEKWSTASSGGGPGVIQPKSQSSTKPGDPPKSGSKASPQLLSIPTAPLDEELPKVADRPVLETHLSDQTLPEPPPVHAAMARLSLNASHSQSEKAVRPSGDVDQPLAMRVLVVEDNAVNRRIVVAMLKRTACQYAEAVDGDDAVRQFMAFGPDLVLLDINMPVKDGFQAASEMRAIEARQAGPKRAKIIAVTALSQEQSKRKGMLECGIDEWRTKPVSLKTLREDVERMKI